jgi:hypothetical protein
MNRDKPALARRRLSLPPRPTQTQPLELYPVRKVEVAEPGSVYYIPVSGFPLPELEREQLRRFGGELRNRYAQLAERPLFNYLGIINSVVEYEVLQLVVTHMFDWRPLQALAFLPELPPAHLPTAEEIRSGKSDFSPEKMHEIMPMMTCITRKNAVGPAYDALFGCGGATLYLSPLEEQKFFQMTKEVFGHRITEPMFQPLNCLPYFRISALLDATEGQFEAMYSTLGLYMGESMKDKGLVITCDRCLDEVIADLVDLLKDGRVVKDPASL